MPNLTSWLEISRSAFQHNIRQFKKIIGPKVRLMAIVKSNAYGHGLKEVSSICQKAKEVDWLGTVNLTEALALRKFKIKKPILVLSYYQLDAAELSLAIKNNITLVVYQKEQFIYLNKIAGRLHKKAKVHFKVDTGTLRLGVSPEEALQCINTLVKYKNLVLEGLFTHYATAEEKDQRFTIRQTEKFQQLIQNLEKSGLKILLKHVACSAAILISKSYHFDLVRLGISLYGLWSLENHQKIKAKYHLKPALTWKTKIIQIKTAEKGQSIGYGRTYQTKKNIKIAILPVGYYEGYDRRLSNRGEVLIRGQRCLVRGRICMNLMMVDISQVKNVKIDDEAVILGKEGREEITADELAEKIGTINYEVVTRINPLIPRIIHE